MEETKTVSVLMLDIQDSTPLAKQLGSEAYLKMLDGFRGTVTTELDNHHGTEFQKQAELGDDCMKADFPTPRDAVVCAINIQNHFKHYGVVTNPDGSELKLVLHLAVHTCPTTSDERADLTEMSDLARLLTHAHDGQILLSPACHDAYDAAHGPIPDRCEKFGGYFFKGIEGEQSIYSLLYDSHYRGAPGTQFIGFENLEAANEYITRAAVEKIVRDKFEEAVGSRGGKIRFVTICGEGGMGKTRLSINCARQLVGRFPGYVVFVPLAGLLKHDAEGVAEAIYSALNLKTPGADVEEQWRQLGLYLKSRPATLILLDNAEAVTHDKTVVAYIKSLLEKVPQLCFLASSRHWFGLGSGQEGRVDVNDGLTPWEAFQLFQDQAQGRGFALPEGVGAEETADLDKRIGKAPEYALPHDTPSSGREHDLLCLLRVFHLANFNALALELIASGSGFYKTATELLESYGSDALGELTASDELPYGDETTQERHESLPASYRWSWNTLGKHKGSDAQAAFLAAALFADTFTRESVNAVLGWDDQARTNAALKAVQDAALCRAVVAAEGTQTRYLMHWQLQTFGREEKFWQHSTGKEASLPVLVELRRNYVTYYKEKTEKYGDANGIGSTDGRAWLGSEWRNVVMAADYADSEEKLAEAVQLRLCLTPYFDITGNWHIWEEVGEKSNDAAVRTENRYIQAAVLNNLGVVYWQRGRWEDAEKAHDKALTLLQEVGDLFGQGKVLNGLGNVYQQQNKWEKAETAYLETLAICEEFKDRRGQGETLNNLGIVYKKQGKTADAEKAHDKALILLQEVKDQRGEAAALHSLGNIFREREELESAKKAYDKALFLFSKVGDLLGQSKALTGLGNVYQQQNKWEDAEIAYNDSLAIKKDFGDRYGRGVILNNLGIVYKEQGKWEKAEMAYNDSLVIKKEVGDQRGQGQTLRNIAILWINQKDFDKAADYVREGIKVVQKTEDTGLLQQLQDLLDYCINPNAVQKGSIPWYLRLFRMTKRRS